MDPGEVSLILATQPRVGISDVLYHNPQAEPLSGFQQAGDLSRLMLHRFESQLAGRSQHKAPPCQVSYSLDIMEQAKAALSRLYNCRGNLDFAISNARSGEIDAELTKRFESRRRQFCEVMEDDLNTADAISAVFELAKDINVAVSSSPSKETLEFAASVFDELCDILGLRIDKKNENLDADIEALIEKRQQARKARDFKTADSIRDELKNRGIILEDTPKGVKWSYEKK
jgi:cysteinyl-tRNA synthetase